MATEIGRIASLTQRVEVEESPLEGEVRRVAWLIAKIALAMGIAFVPIAALGAGLPIGDAVVLTIGLIVGNVPEGLLPVITLALAVGVRGLVREGAVVKRLSAVETLGSTDVICTDKTGTLTENRMRVTRSGPSRAPARWTRSAQLGRGDRFACNNARLGPDGEPPATRPRSAMLLAAAERGVDVDAERRARPHRRAQFHFDPA